jgi:hypothetical protein
VAALAVSEQAVENTQIALENARRALGINGEGLPGDLSRANPSRCRGPPAGLEDIGPSEYSLESTRI